MELSIVPFKPDQLTINWYEPGCGIASHVETHSAFEDGLASISLESEYFPLFSFLQKKLIVRYVMTFKDPDDVQVFLPRSFSFVD